MNERQKWTLGRVCCPGWFPGKSGQKKEVSGRRRRRRRGWGRWSRAQRRQQRRCQAAWPPPTSHAGRRPPCLNCLERRRPLAPHVCPGPRSAGDPDPPPSTRGPGGKPPTLRHQPLWTRTLATSSWPPAFQVSLVVGSALQQVLHPLPDVVKLGPHVPANHCPVGRTPAHTTSPPPPTTIFLIPLLMGASNTPPTWGRQSGNQTYLYPRLEGSTNTHHAMQDGKNAVNLPIL